MMNIVTSHALLNQTLMLSAQRALYWLEERLLIVADPHFGKAQVFRDKGVPVPAGTTADDLNRLSVLIDRLSPAGLLILGDLVHGQMDNTNGFERLIGTWRQHHRSVRIHLVTGNHDLSSGQLPYPFSFDQISTEWIRHPFAFAHKPDPHASLYRIAGHLHPAVTIRGKGGLKETLPCFCFGSRTALMPAFGSFTGNHPIQPGPEDRIYVIADDDVIEVPHAKR